MTTTLILSAILMLAVIIAFVAIYFNMRRIISKIKAIEKEALESDVYNPFAIL